MIKSVMLSRFTPSLLEPDVLEAIFVRRESLASRLVELVRESALTRNRHYVLLVGPRGIGKTHLVSLVYHRLRQDAALAERLRVAWLREEEWGITSYLDLLLAILRALGEQHPEAGLAQPSEAIVGLPAEQAELEAEKAIRDCAGARTVLLIAENLDEIFRGLGEEGQRKLRAFIQNRPVLTILATSTSLFGGVSLRTSPFYGFFEVHHLDELPFEDAVSLLVKIAEHEGDKQLAARLTTPAGRARIRALHHLAGGNPRVYVIFSQFLTCESLDQLTDAVLRTLDDLTPYCQARMNYLSPQQRKIVSFLCDRRGAVPVGEIAEGNFLSHQGASSQLKKLREFGYVRSHQLGRESYYELREPLMRMAMEVKKTRGRPVPLLVDFLCLWYSRSELNELFSQNVSHTLESRYLLETAQKQSAQAVDPRVTACARDYRKLMTSGDYAHAFQVAEELIALEPCMGWLAQGRCLQEQGDHSRSLQAFNRSIEQIEDSECLFNAHVHCARSYSALKRDQECLASLEKALEIASMHTVDESPITKIREWHDLLEEAFRLSNKIMAFDLAVANKVDIEHRLQLYHGGGVSRDDIAHLGWSMVKGIPAIFDTPVSAEALKCRLEGWKQLGVRHEELALPLRLLHAAVEYRETKDKRVLLRLPVEEREILQSLLPE